MKDKNLIKGISIINPDKIEKDYYLECIDYAVKNDINHIQITGPIHDMVIGNVDGMIFNKKYKQFNNEKDIDYINMCLNVVNEGLEISHSNNIKTFMWHHELILPDDFKNIFPEAINENGDIEISHPIVKDYLENKILDFFSEYPKMDGIVLTLHETKIPLLKLKNQKLSPVERVKYITKIIFDVCNKLNKELIVRPFASIEKDQMAMLDAYADISPSLMVMDKWTKFDWSLVLPHNDFFKKITKNPFCIETDIFGEYFGLGQLPIMLKKHITDKVNYCNKFNHSGFVSRIDRDYNHVFGSVNEINLVIMHALTNNLDLEDEINKFFTEKYGECGKEIYALMKNTEDIQKKIFFSDGYYFVQGSYFPDLNHSINHFFFELMKDDFSISSDEWFLPVNKVKPTIDTIFKEKKYAVTETKNMLSKLENLNGKLSITEYNRLYTQFFNLSIVAKLWYYLAKIVYSYTKYFDTFDEKYENDFYIFLKKLEETDGLGKKELKEKYYNSSVSHGLMAGSDRVSGFISDIKERFNIEKNLDSIERQKSLTDYVICGGATESHDLKKEVNFSDTLVINGDICRITGNKKGAKWSSINAHGWFSYKLKARKNHSNKIYITLGSITDTLSLKINICGVDYEIKEKIKGKKIYSFKISPDSDYIIIRFDRIDFNTPLIYLIEVK